MANKKAVRTRGQPQGWICVELTRILRRCPGAARHDHPQVHLRARQRDRKGIHWK